MNTRAHHSAQMKSMATHSGEQMALLSRTMGVSEKLILTQSLKGIELSRKESPVFHRECTIHMSHGILRRQQVVRKGQRIGSPVIMYIPIAWGL